MTTRYCQVMPKAYPLPQPGEPINPAAFKLSTLCARGHDWNGTGLSLRYAKPRGACVICARETALAKVRQRREQEPDYRDRQAAYMRERRAREGREYRGKHPPEWHQQRRDEAILRRALERARLSPTVAQLVYRQQQEYWQANPEANLAYRRQYCRWLWKWRYMVDQAYNRHERQRNSQRKARNRGNHTSRISQGDLTRRFEQFDCRCCYCGSGSRIEVEHFIPRSKGGPHAMGNLLPACQECNKLKRNHDPETWYRSQPFFSDQRWRKIRRVLGLTQAPVGQLALL